ncbi:uncharacterized protein LOC126846635 [Adelges cooleyi]|uniref:uncharacterized protein LOC126846635 n=1 Tax=Adelges cooleyi TaxID=133065 RepID=UPI00217FA60C|nr:uncharacterized protein LOC126846635 [Adelges cooleyi]
MNSKNIFVVCLLVCFSIQKTFGQKTEDGGVPTEMVTDEVTEPSLGEILESVHELVCKLYSTHYGNELSMMNFLDFVGDSHIDLVNRYIELPHVVRKSDVLEEEYVDAKLFVELIRFICKETKNEPLIFTLQLLAKFKDLITETSDETEVIKQITEEGMNEKKEKEGNWQILQSAFGSMD